MISIVGKLTLFQKKEQMSRKATEQGWLAFREEMVEQIVRMSM